MLIQYQVEIYVWKTGIAQLVVKETWLVARGFK
jgi:hypothetical protein